MAKPAVRAFQRSFRLIDPSTVVVTIGSRQTRYSVGILTAYGFDGTPEDVVALRAGRELFHVTVARDGSAMCHCSKHFDDGSCWHADLAVAILKRLNAPQSAPAVAAENAAPPSPREADNTILTVETADGSLLATITCESGLWRSHRKLADLIRSKPLLLSNPEQVEALERSIAGTRICVTRIPNNAA